MSITVQAFLDAENDIRPELFDDEAKDIAKKLKGARITTHQVRRFYDEVKRYKARLDQGEPYKRIKPLIVMLKSKAKYAATKKPNMSIFYDFIEKSVDYVKEGDEEIQKKKFDAFCLFFEAVYGFAELKNN